MVEEMIAFNKTIDPATLDERQSELNSLFVNVFAGTIQTMVSGTSWLFPAAVSPLSRSCFRRD